jgi:dUTP pyrophosphatase
MTETENKHNPPSLPASPAAKRSKPEMTAPVTSIQQPLPPLLVKKLVESAQAPTRGSAFAAGYDLYAAKETVIPAKGKAGVDTGLAIAVPEGTCRVDWIPEVMSYADENRRPYCSPQRTCC